jgi:hypothetical protein
VDGLFSGVIVMPQSQMAIVLYLGCAAAGEVAGHRAQAPQRRRQALRWLSAGAGGHRAVRTRYGGGARVCLRHAAHAPLTPAEQAINPSTHWPRIWEAGYF